jgi:hypothetical protein
MMKNDRLRPVIFLCLKRFLVEINIQTVMQRTMKMALTARIIASK